MNLTKLAMKRILELVSYEDLNDDLKLIADAEGMEHAKSMIEHFGGIPFHIKHITSCDIAIAKYIEEELSQGRPIKKLACELGTRPRTIQKILNKHNKRGAF